MELKPLSWIKTHLQQNFEAAVDAFVGGVVGAATIVDNQWRVETSLTSGNTRLENVFFTSEVFFDCRSCVVLAVKNKGPSADPSIFNCTLLVVRQCLSRKEFFGITPAEFKVGGRPRHMQSISC